MAKYYGKIGFIESIEEDPVNHPSVYTEKKTERYYFGDVTRNSRRWQPSEHLNDNLEVSNTISIVADPYALNTFHAMRYIEWMGTLWKINYVEVAYPRLNLTIGGVYNG